MGNEGFQSEARAPGSVAHLAKKGIKLLLISPCQRNLTSV